MGRKKKHDIKKLLPLGIIFGIFGVLTLFATYDLIKLIIYDHLLGSYSKPIQLVIFISSTLALMIIAGYPLKKVFKKR